jgi:hypothetical protein
VEEGWESGRVQDLEPDRGEPGHAGSAGRMDAPGRAGRDGGDGRGRGGAVSRGSAVAPEFGLDRRSAALRIPVVFLNLIRDSVRISSTRSQSRTRLSLFARVRRAKSPQVGSSVRPGGCHREIPEPPGRARRVSRRLPAETPPPVHVPWFRPRIPRVWFTIETGPIGGRRRNRRHATEDQEEKGERWGHAGERSDAKSSDVK